MQEEKDVPISFHGEDRRDALHSLVRRLCGNRKVTQCRIRESLAIVEFPEEVIIVKARKKAFEVLKLTNHQAFWLCYALRDMFE